jgi:uncharacterized protein (DUF58 family)
MTAVLDPALLPRLARLSLLTRRRADGAPAGNRAGRRRGPSLEFADHRAYADGDDLRFLDWKVLARHDQPFVRRFYEEQALPVRILLDTSASMGFGEPRKLDIGRALAAGIAFVGLAGGAVVSLHPFASLPARPLGPLRGRRRLHEVLDRLGSLGAGGASDLTAAALSVVSPLGRAGLTVIVSDFLCPGGVEEALARLDHARHAVFLLRVVAPDEEEPALGGDLTLVDSESGEEMGVTLTPSLLEAYRRLRAEDEAKLEEAARRRGAGTARARSDASLTELFFRELPARGLLE